LHPLVSQRVADGLVSDLALLPLDLAGRACITVLETQRLTPLPSTVAILVVSILLYERSRCRPMVVVQTLAFLAATLREA